MTPESATVLDDPATARSSQSLAFEEFWRGLPRTGLVPDRKDFRPERAGRFLRDIVLLETPTGEHPGLRIRIIGGSFQEKIQDNVAGRDYLDFLPQEYHNGALDSARAMVALPCGLWQVMPIHFERGYSQFLEITAFPLLPADDGIPLLLVHVRLPELSVAPRTVAGRPMLIDTATTFAFIDLGNGVPDWPPRSSH